MATNPKQGEAATLKATAEGLAQDLRVLRDNLASVRPVVQEAAAVVAEIRELAAQLAKAKE